MEVSPLETLLEPGLCTVLLPHPGTSMKLLVVVVPKAATATRNTAVPEVARVAEAAVSGAAQRIQEANGAGVSVDQAARPSRRRGEQITATSFRRHLELVPRLRRPTLKVSWPQQHAGRPELQLCGMKS